MRNRVIEVPDTAKTRYWHETIVNPTILRFVFGSANVPVIPRVFIFRDILSGPEKYIGQEYDKVNKDTGDCYNTIYN